MVPFGTFFAHVSTPTRITTTKLLLGPLSVARGKKIVSLNEAVDWFLKNDGNSTKAINILLFSRLWPQNLPMLKLTENDRCSLR